jgi:hypothetical protein
MVPLLCAPLTAAVLVLGARARETVRHFARAQLPSLEAQAGVTQLLCALASTFAVNELAQRVGVSRFVVSRWLSGKAAIRLPNLLRFVEATTLRSLDFIALLITPSLLPSVAADYRRLLAARSSAYDAPWSHAVLRVIELESYRQAGPHRAGWIARRIGIDVEEEQRCIALLLETGQIERRRRRYEVVQRGAVETGTDVVRRQALRAFWANTAIQRLSAGEPGVFAYNLFAIAESELERLTELHNEFFAKMRALVAASTPSERIVLFATQIVPLDRTS